MLYILLRQLLAIMSNPCSGVISTYNLLMAMKSTTPYQTHDSTWKASILGFGVFGEERQT